MHADNKFFNAALWSAEDLDRVSNLRGLHVDNAIDGNWLGLSTLEVVLQACSSTLIDFTLGEDPGIPPLQFDFPNLSRLSFRYQSELSRVLIQPLPNLRHLEGPPESLAELKPKNLRSLSFVVESDSDEGCELQILQSMDRLCKGSSSTLDSVRLKTDWDSPRFSVDLFLSSTLKINFLLAPICPCLSRLYISKDQEYSSRELAEAIFSRNFASKGWKFDNEVGEERSCSNVTLYLDLSHIGGFRNAEEKVISEYSKNRLEGSRSESGMESEIEINKMQECESRPLGGEGERILFGS